MKSYEYEVERQRESSYSAIEKRLNLQKIGAFLRTGNGDVERHFRANFRAGYWEIVFLHNMPLGIVPKEMRVR